MDICPFIVEFLELRWNRARTECQRKKPNAIGTKVMLRHGMRSIAKEEWSANRIGFFELITSIVAAATADMDSQSP
ncbi:MAG: hypothetical protein HEQ39_09260 [Rhizobacter sp.]